ncbi:MAG: molybdate ABC transporter substrate-binding protein [Leptospirales bacterium]|nr:molybdate ABC transporter substrate-binding protein [Leptospirales bacterium]
MIKKLYHRSLILKRINSILILFVIVLPVFTYNSCAKNNNTEKVYVAVAGSMANTAELLSKDFQERFGDSDNKIILIKASSGKIASQIINGAPFDIFMSADMNFPESVYNKGLSLKPQVYAKGRLIFFSRLGIASEHSLSILNNRDIKFVAIANPDLAPYGRAAIEAIKNSNINFSKEKFLISENVMQCAIVTLNSADAGFISKSALYLPAMLNFIDKKDYWFEVDERLYSPLYHSVILLKRSEANRSAVKFYEYIFSDYAEDILIKNGFDILTTKKN